MDILYYILDTKTLLILLAVCMANEMINHLQKPKAKGNSKNHH